MVAMRQVLAASEPSRGWIEWELHAPAARVRWERQPDGTAALSTTPPTMVDVIRRVIAFALPSPDAVPCLGTWETVAEVLESPGKLGELLRRRWPSVAEIARSADYADYRRRQRVDVDDVVF